MGDVGEPLTRQRSPWTRTPETGRMRLLLDQLEREGSVGLSSWFRNVHDGVLHALVGREPTGPGGTLRWHLSVSHAPNGRRSRGRYPTWDELAHARYELLPEDATVAMLLPPPDEYVAVHETTFHLWELPEAGS